MKTNFIKKIAVTLTACILLLASLLCFTSCEEDSLKTFDGISVTDVTVTYDQTGHNVAVYGIENYQGITVEMPEEEINVGEYSKTVTFKKDGYNTLSITATLKIEKATPLNLIPQTTGENTKFEIDTLRTQWTGSPRVVTAFCNYEQRDSAVVEYYSEGVKLNSAPVDAGEYEVKITLIETNNYKALTKTFSFIIFEPMYTANVYVLNPTTNEPNELGVFTFERGSEINLVGVFEIPVFNGYKFDGWYVDNQPIHAVYDYDKGVTIIAKYVEI